MHLSEPITDHPHSIYLKEQILIHPPLSPSIMTRRFIPSTLNIFVICCCFLWRQGTLVRATENFVSFSSESPMLSRFGKESANTISSNRKPTVKLADLKGHVPSCIQSSAPAAAPSSFVGNTQNDRDEHTAWLLQQQQYDQQQYQIQSSTLSTASASSPRRGKGMLPSFVSTQSLATLARSIFQSARVYSDQVYRESPTTYWTALSSIIIFLSWNLLPPARSVLAQYFLASRRSAQQTFGLSLILSTVSHTSFRHILVNLFVFLNLASTISSIRVPSSSWAAKTRLRSSSQLSKAALWPFLLGGLSGNLLFLLFRPGGSCLGLSGVTCAMMGAYASAMPDRVLRIMLMGIIPVSLRAATMVQCILAVSIAGSLFAPSSPVCHLGHLGGLLFGLLYYQNVMIAGSSKQMLPMKMLFGQ